MRVKATKQWRRTLQIVVLGEEALPPSQNRNEAIDAAEVVQATPSCVPNLSRILQPDHVDCDWEERIGSQRSSEDW